ncbi:MAG: deoxyguanosinetriphosphate triphosphohydrolase [Bryobacterales bacterium]
MPANLRFPSEQSRGRRFPEPSHRYRNVYQRDRDRIVHSRAFRRLEHKTQVFTTPHSDHFRNRLTHTIEVSQIARTVAGALDLNEDLVEALALSHDLGHPPFGHAGEDVLDEEMRRYGDSFDHNLHSLRIVDHFEHRYPRFRGLNLTFEVREGIVKHSRSYDAETHPELAEFLLDQRPLIEAQLIDLSDSVAYNCADLDDAVDSGLLEASEARRHVSTLDRLMSEAAREFPDTPLKIIFHEALRRVLDLLVSGLIEGTRDAVERAGVETPEDVRRYPELLATLAADAGALCGELRQLLLRQVYRSEELALERETAGHKVASLFRLFMEQPAKLPRAYEEQSGEEPLHRVVCDYIAGMTDKFLIARYEELVEGRRAG